MPQIPSVGKVKDAELRNILSAIKEKLEVLAGERGDINDRALLVSDLVGIGTLGVLNDTLYDPGAPAAAGFITQPVIYEDVIAESGLNVFDENEVNVQVIM